MRWWLAILMGVWGAPVAAQDTLPGLPPGNAVGGTLEYYMVNGVSLPGAALRVTGLAAGRWRPTFAVGAVFGQSGGSPGALTLELGSAYNHPVRGAHLLVEGGATGLMVAADGANASFIGAYVGAGIIGRVSEGLGLRVGLGRRWFLTGYRPVGVTVFSVGLTALPRRAPAAASPP